MFFSAEGVAVRNSGPAGISQSGGSGTESRTFTGKFHMGLSQVDTWISTLSDSCALQVRQEIEEVTRQAQKQESAQSTQVNTGCACINSICFHFPVCVLGILCSLSFIKAFW